MVLENFENEVLRIAIKKKKKRKCESGEEKKKKNTNSTTKRTYVIAFRLTL